MLILRLRQPARSKERGNSFAGGQGADLHSPCTPGRERAVTGTPSRLTFALFAVNKICVNLCNPFSVAVSLLLRRMNLWFNFFYLFSVFSVPSVAKTKSVLICAICGYFCVFASLWPILSFACYSSTPKVKKCKKMVQKVYILVHFCSKRAHF
jgi:hypothetical protein